MLQAYIDRESYFEHIERREKPERANSEETQRTYSMIKFSCTQCGHSYRVSDEYAGKKVKCKGCATVKTIPSPAADTEKSVIGSGDSIAAYNNLLQELLKYEQQAPPLEIETSRG
jgi:ribosomal protein S27E